MNNKVYRLKYKRNEHPAGVLVVEFEGHDYGLCREDQEVTGMPHIMMKLANGLGGAFTIAKEHLEEYTPGMPSIDPTTPAPEIQTIEGKKVVKYVGKIAEVVVGQGTSLMLNDGESFARTSRVEKIEGTTIHTKNTVYVKVSEEG